MCFVGKISSRLKKSWNIFSFFFLFISSSSISFIYQRFLLLLNFKSGYLFVATFLLRVVRRLKTYSIFAHRSLSSRISLSLSLYIFSISLLTARLLFIPEDKKCHAERTFKRREQRKETMILKRVSKKKNFEPPFSSMQILKNNFFTRK